MYQGVSDALLGPTNDIRIADEIWGIDFEAEVATFLGDVPMGTSAEETGAAIRLITLINDVSLRNLLPGESEKGLGFIHAKPPSSVSPIAVTPDELGTAWDGKRVHLPLLSYLNGEPFGCPNAGEDMTFDYPTLIAHAAKTRPLSAGTMLGGGTVSNRDERGGCGKPIAQGGRGYSCIAERRMVEVILRGSATTSFMRHGDRVRIEMIDGVGQSIFGAIDQKVVVG
jgi:fumarylacetoacetate (FAA) hydrolase